MNVLKILEQISKVDEDALDRIGSRRNMFKSAGKWGSKAALAGLPLALGASVNKAYAGTGKINDVLDVLNFALTLEYLEAEFYTQVESNTNLLPAGSDARPIIELIMQHENAHVEFLKTAISGAGGTPVSKPTFDFTAGGMFPDPSTTDNSQLATIMAVAQAFEDTGVRAYKGQAPALISNNDVLTAALQIHSVEARHASEIRRYRGSKGWIVLANNSTGAAAVDPVYAGEDNTTHQISTGTFDVLSLTFPGGEEAATESFDEPLTMQEVLAIADPFIV